MCEACLGVSPSIDSQSAFFSKTGATILIIMTSNLRVTYLMRHKHDKDLADRSQQQWSKARVR